MQQPHVQNTYLSGVNTTAICSTPTLTVSKQQSRVQYTYFNGVNITINFTAHLPKQCQYNSLMYSTCTLALSVQQTCTVHQP